MATLSHKLSVYSDGSVKTDETSPTTNLRTMIAINQRIGGDTNQRNVYLTPSWNNDAGADWPITLGQKEKELIYRVNPGEFWNSRWISTEEKMQWACKVDTIGYLYMAEGSRASNWKWWFIVMASRVNYPAQVNVVNVLRYSGAWADIETIPVLDNYDHLNPETQPWLFPQVYATASLTPKGHFCMPLFSPIGRPHPNTDITGTWIPTEYLMPL
jgi:hypothetical protein